MGDLQGARYIRSLPYLNGKVGIIGYCSGGRQAYLAACTLPGIDAAVDCYGGRSSSSRKCSANAIPSPPIDLTKDLPCPLLGLFGNDDVTVAGAGRRNRGGTQEMEQDLFVQPIQRRRPLLLRGGPDASATAARDKYVAKHSHAIDPAFVSHSP